MILQPAALWVSILYGTGVVVEDLDRQKISNRSIAWGLAFVLAGLVGLGATGLMAPGVPVFLAQFAAHAALASFAAVVLWLMKVWPAGDAKLFIVFALLTVVIDPLRRGFPDYLFLTLLVNIFVPAGLFIVAIVSLEWAAWLANADLKLAAVELAARASRLRVRFADEWRHRWNYLRGGVSLYALFFAFQCLRARIQPMAKGTLAQLALYLALLLVWRPVGRILVQRKTAAAALSAVAMLMLPIAWLTGKAVFGPMLSSLRMLASFGFVLTAGRSLLIGYLEASRLRTIVPSDIKPGMVLSPLSRASFSVRAVAPREYPDGLSESEADELRRKLERRRLKPALSVYRTRSFSIWIAVGFAWTLFSHRNAVQCFLALAGLRQ